MRKLLYSLPLILGFTLLVVIEKTASPKAALAPEIPLAETPTPIPKETVLAAKDTLLIQKESTLLAAIETIIPKEATVGLAVTDLKENRTFGTNKDLPLPAASVNKVTTAAYLLNEVYKGNVSLDQDLDYQSVKSHLRDLLKVSSNESWDILGNLLGWENINEFGRLLGTKNTDLIENVASAEDFNIILAAILDHKIGSADLTDLFLSYMQNTETEDRIPASLPKGTTIYHKSGSINTSINDSAIVLTENPFILTVLTKDVPGGRDGASALIRKITNLVYTSLNNSL